MSNQIILGAGLAGCLAGLTFPKAIILEKEKKLKVNHHAVLRFRSPEIGKMCGIPFEKVSVRKSIWFEGKEVYSAPRFSNWYSRKVSGGVTVRSIEDISCAERWVAPINFHEMLLDRVKDRIVLEEPVDNIRNNCVETSKNSYDNLEWIISTLPMPIMQKIAGIKLLDKFGYNPIYVRRVSLEDTHTHQTIYYPEPSTSIYRATITNNILIIESMNPMSRKEFEEVLNSFGLVSKQVLKSKDLEQPFGKIIPVDNEIRKQLISEFTKQKNIFSLGRFAVWRNILLDDVYDDLVVLQQLTKQSLYDITLKGVKDES